MPRYKKTYKKYPSRRTRYKRMVKKRRTRKIPRGFSTRYKYSSSRFHSLASSSWRPENRVTPAIMPTKKIINFKTCIQDDFVTIATQNNTLAVVKGNSAFTPFNTAPSADAAVPHFFSEWSAFYDTQKVLSSLLVVKAVSDNTAEDFRLAIVPLRTSTVLSNALKYSDLCDYPRMHFSKLISANTNDDIPLNARQGRISYKTTPQSIYKGTAFTNDNFSAAVGADPTKTFFYHVLAIPNKNGSFTVTKKIELTYELYTTVELTVRDV